MNKVYDKCVEYLNDGYFGSLDNLIQLAEEKSNVSLNDDDRHEVKSRVEAYADWLNGNINDKFYSGV